RRGQGEIILLVDDETAILEMTRAILEDANYNVAVASDGIQALEVYRRLGQCQLLIADAKMPIMDGHALVQALRAMNPGLAVICTTGERSGTQKAQMQSAGVQTFLYKPYSAAEILALVSKVLAFPPASGPARPPLSSCA
ncbi:MAG TPA: response regulator, partial [Verrucomicrobiae bacterium]|nr:response regulator [Verrucomicrobiae bacterium]